MLIVRIIITGLEDSRNDNCATCATSTRTPTSTSTARNRFKEKEAVSGHCGRKDTSRRRSRGTPTVAYKKGEQVRASHQDSWPKHSLLWNSCLWVADKYGVHLVQFQKGPAVGALQQICTFSHSGRTTVSAPQIPLYGFYIYYALHSNWESKHGHAIYQNQPIIKILASSV